MYKTGSGEKNQPTGCGNHLREPSRQVTQCQYDHGFGRRHMVVSPERGKTETWTCSESGPLGITKAACWEWEKAPIAQQRPQTVAGWDSLLQELRYYCQSVPWLERTYPLSVVRSIYQAVKVRNPAKGKEPGTLPWLVVALTALDWCTWIQHKWATYLCDNWVRSHQSWSHHSTSMMWLWLLLQLLPSGPSGPPSPPSLLSHPTSCACPHLSPSPHGCPWSPKSAPPPFTQLN